MAAVTSMGPSLPRTTLVERAEARRGTPSGDSSTSITLIHFRPSSALSLVRPTFRPIVAGEHAGMSQPAAEVAWILLSRHGSPFALCRRIISTQPTSTDRTCRVRTQQPGIASAWRQALLWAWVVVTLRRRPPARPLQHRL